MGKKKFNRKESAWRGFIGPTILLYSVWNVTLNEWDIHINGLCFFSLIFNFMPSQKKLLHLTLNFALPLARWKKAKQKNTVYQKWLNLFMVCVFTIHNQGLSQFAFQEVHFNYNTQRFISTSRFIDTKNVGSRGHKEKLPPPPVPFPVQIQRIGKYIYSFSLCLYVRLSTQVCTRAVVR